MHTKTRYTDRLDAEMAAYPNILTPPMDSPDFVMFSPDSENSGSPPAFYISQMPNPRYLKDGYEALLEILEEPVEKFRFRYKSEMAGTHGSLNGRNSDRSRKQTFPCVRLLHYREPAIIRCSLYQIGRSEPHAHRLVKRVGSDEMDDPHDIEVGPDDFIANFTNMGIIHTAKKYIVNELLRKYTVLKRESINREEGTLRPLTAKEETELLQRAEAESSHINLNQVCLRFDAFKCEKNGMIPICSPVYSGTINNLKSALTGDLKIVRMDHCTSTTRGGREIFILVEKVTKKNIKVRFFELDEDENEIWSDFGRFSDLDVHHQYAIVFKTPAYRIIDIDKPAKVFIELQRPSDGARSEPKEFTYTPCEIILGRKRARGSYSSSTSSIGFSSNELPSILPNCDLYVNSKELNDALANNNVDSAEFTRICDHLIGNGNGIQDLYAEDDSITMDGSSIRPILDKGKSLRSGDDAIINRIESELVHFLNSSLKLQSLPKQRLQVMLESVMDNQKYKFENGNNILHHLILKDNSRPLSAIIFSIIQKYELSSIADLRNKLGQTALHLAVQMRNEKAIDALLQGGADLSIQDLHGNTPLHFAIMREVPESVLAQLFKNKHKLKYIDLKNNEGNTALHLAVKTNNLVATTMLCSNEANIDVASNTNGYTPLHMAVADQHTKIITYLLEHGCNTKLEDFNGSNALRLANVLIHEEKPVTLEIYKTMESHMKKIGTFQEIFIKEEDATDEISDMEVDLTDKIKTDPDLLENEECIERCRNLRTLPDECIQQIASILSKSKTSQELADRLDCGHLVRTGLFNSDPYSINGLVKFILASSEDLVAFRQALVSLGLQDAVNILDKATED